ncbi:hypothetical protein NEOLEDRAFT_1073920, partial [Neolentinus lepideus HHB14362 ss-1]
NYRSSELDTKFIDTYIAGEVAAGWYSEGFEPAELEWLIRPFQTSPLGLVPKVSTSKL